MSESKQILKILDAYSTGENDKRAGRSNKASQLKKALRQAYHNGFNAAARDKTK